MRGHGGFPLIAASFAQKISECCLQPNVGSVLVWPKGTLKDCRMHVRSCHVWSCWTELDHLIVESSTRPEPQIIGIAQCIGTVLPFRAPGSSSQTFSSLIFFLLLFSSLTLPILLCIYPCCGSSTSKLPSIIHCQTSAIPSEAVKITYFALNWPAVLVWFSFTSKLLTQKGYVVGHSTVVFIWERTSSIVVQQGHVRTGFCSYNRFVWCVPVYVGRRCFLPLALNFRKCAYWSRGFFEARELPETV